MKDALADAELALSHHHENCRARCMRAWAMAHLGQVDQALQELDDVVRLNRDDIRVQQVQGHCYLIARRFADATRVLRESVKRDPSSAIAYSDLAVALVGLGLEDEAKHILTQCNRIDPMIKRVTEARMDRVRQDR
jgi:predicted Zn-dependent protease